MIADNMEKEITITYQVIEELGRGGMGRVYKVFDERIKEKVALKLLKPEIVADEPSIERFSNELRFARKIAHRHVCRMFDLGEDRGTRYITMEYVPGEDLKNVLRMMGPMSVGKAVLIARQVTSKTKMAIQACGNSSTASPPVESPKTFTLSKAWRGTSSNRGEESMLIKRVLWIGLSLLAFLQIGFGQVIKTPQADIEFIGLKNWTAQKLYEDISKANPDKPFHACMSDLKDRLGFAGAYVSMDFSQKRPYVLVAVVEPQFASRIRYKALPGDARPAVARWSVLAEMLKSHADEFSAANQLYGFFVNKSDFDLSRFFDDESILLVKQIWENLSRMNSEEDKKLAFATVDQDGDSKNRILALTVLGNFLDSDSTWRVVVDSFRDQNEIVAQTATRVLANMVDLKYKNKTVDWSSAALALRALLDGTNTFAFIPTVKILTATKVSPKLAGSLLKEGGSLLIDFLNAERRSEKDLAHGLLVQLAGKDLGTDSAKWAAWIKSL